MIEMSKVPFVTRRAFMIGTGSAAAAFGVQSLAQGRITINPGEFQPMPIAIPNFFGGEDGDNSTATGVSQIITADLKGSGLFLPIDPAAFLQKLASVDSVPNFPDWRTINAQALVSGRVARQSDGRLRAEFRLCGLASFDSGNGP